MGDRYKAFWLGVFVILAIAVVTWLFLFLRPNVGDGKEIIKVRFANVEGINIGTRVTFAGRPVGEVYEIEEIFDARDRPSDGKGDLYFYQVVLKVDSKVKIYNYDEIMFTTSGLVGEKSVSIIPKATPPGAPPAHEVTGDILYAKSTDQLEQIFQKINDVAGSLNSAMQRINEFLDENMEEFSETLTSINQAASSFTTLANEATANQLPEKAADALAALTTAMSGATQFFDKLEKSELIDRLSNSVGKIERGEGTLGKLLNSDTFYLQVQAVMCKLETVLSDINNYGLLFQYDKSWQRRRVAKMNRMQRLCTPDDFTRYFNCEIQEITISLDQVGSLLQEMECREIPTDDPCFARQFRELMGRVECLNSTLKNYNEMLYKQYCDMCN